MYTLHQFPLRLKEAGLGKLVPLRDGIPRRHHILASGRKRAEGQIQTVMLAQHLQPPGQSHHLSVAIELEEVLREREPVRIFNEYPFEIPVGAQFLREPVLNRALTGVAERRIPHVVQQRRARRDGGDIVGIFLRNAIPHSPDRRLRKIARNAADFERMGEAGTYRVMRLKRKDVGLILQPPHRRAENDAAQILLELRAVSVRETRADRRDSN